MSTVFSEADGLTEEQQRIIEANHFYMARVIQGKLCALHTYATTVGLVVGIDDISYERRYCYPNPIDAIRAMTEYTDLSVHAPGNWIKVKGRFQGEPIDDFNPNFTKDA